MRVLLFCFDAVCILSCVVISDYCEYVSYQYRGYCYLSIGQLLLDSVDLIIQRLNLDSLLGTLSLGCACGDENTRGTHREREWAERQRDEEQRQQQKRQSEAQSKKWRMGDTREMDRKKRGLQTTLPSEKCQICDATLTKLQHCTLIRSILRLATGTHRSTARH